MGRESKEKSDLVMGPGKEVMVEEQGAKGQSSTEVGKKKKICAG